MTEDRSAESREARPAANAPEDLQNAAGAGENAPETLAEALSLRRNARIGVAVGVGLATLVYVPRLPALDVGTTGSAGFYLGLALVLAATTAAVVTAGLSAKVMLGPVLDRRAWLRRGGTAGLVGGVLWAGLPALAWLAGTGAIASGHWRAATGVAGLLLVAGSAGIHAAVRAPSDAGGGRLRWVERVAYWVVVLGLLLASGNASGSAEPVVETGRGALATPFLTATFLAFVAAVPFAASAELLADRSAGAVGSWALRALQVGALGGVLGVAWLVAAGGWGWLAATTGDAVATAAGLAVATVPTGLGWAIAGAGLRTAASRQVDPENPSR